MRLIPGTVATPPSSLVLHYAVYHEIIMRYNQGMPLAIELSTYCDFPVGSGLGASSTIVVAMICAFVFYLKLALNDHEIAELAFYIERVACNFHGGRQDQFAATYGGFNFMEFPPNQPARIFPLQVPDWIKYELEASLILYYTGTSRVSAEIIRDQSTNIHRGDSEALTATHALKKEAELMKDCLLNGDMTGIVDTMRTGWLNKKKLARSVTNPQIDTIYAAALRAGALAGKVSGAGGGGFMMFLAPPKCRSMVLQALKCFGGEISSCHFETHGSQAWQVGVVRSA